MDKVAGLPAAQRNELFSETAARRGMTPAIVEKDFWVTWALDKLFAHSDLSRILMFKGGTSLSKVFGLIERFSEDIDLILDWTILTGEDPQAERSKGRQQKLNQEIDDKGQYYISGELRQKLTGAVSPICRCDVDTTDRHVLNVRYPGAL